MLDYVTALLLDVVLNLAKWLVENPIADILVPKKVIGAPVL